MYIWIFKKHLLFYKHKYLWKQEWKRRKSKRLDSKTITPAKVGKKRWKTSSYYMFLQKYKCIFQNKSLYFSNFRLFMATLNGMNYVWYCCFFSKHVLYISFKCSFYVCSNERISWISLENISDNFKNYHIRLFHMIQR